MTTTKGSEQMTKSTRTKMTDEQAANFLEHDAGPEHAIAVRDRSATDAIRAAVEDRAAAQAAIDAAVADARQAGVTWVEIGVALGVSYQAAMKRYKV